MLTTAGAGVSLVCLAARRADFGEREYGKGFPVSERDLIVEAEQEIGDLANYLVWSLDRIRRGLDPNEWRAAGLQAALRHTVLAFEEIRKLR
jgi:hypothetical protein